MAYESIMQGLNEALDHAQGKEAGARVHAIEGGAGYRYCGEAGADRPFPERISAQYRCRPTCGWRDAAA